MGWLHDDVYKLLQRCASDMIIRDFCPPSSWTYSNMLDDGVSRTHEFTTPTSNDDPTIRKFIQIQYCKGRHERHQFRCCKSPCGIISWKRPNALSPSQLRFLRQSETRNATLSNLELQGDVRMIAEYRFVEHWQLFPTPPNHVVRSEYSRIQGLSRN